MRDHLVVVTGLAVLLDSWYRAAWASHRDRAPVHRCRSLTLLDRRALSRLVTASQQLDDKIYVGRVGFPQRYNVANRVRHYERS